ncbi:hypothetical protein HMPREF9946_04082 [Acetobacteraceae bacterium AT-5844]|nr:hypothetical protein HMPREF9946_04082 [Acetobacteraceae bacterium AT-5844]
MVRVLVPVGRSALVALAPLVLASSVAPVRLRPRLRPVLLRRA